MEYWALMNGELIIHTSLTLPMVGCLFPESIPYKTPEVALPLPLEVNQKVGVRSEYVSLSLGYKDFLFLDGTYRNDYASTLPADNNKYQYPSVTGAFLFSNVIKTDWMSLGKLRLNYAQVGNLAGFDQLYDVYLANSAMNGANNQLAPSKRNPNLKNERTNSLEAGLEMSFFNSSSRFRLSPL